MKSYRFLTSLFAVSLLGAAVLLGCNAESTSTNSGNAADPGTDSADATNPDNDPATAVNPTATTVSFDVTKMT